MKKLVCIIYVLSVLAFASCKDDGLTSDLNKNDQNYDMSVYPDWTESTHGSSAEANYSVLFDQNDVIRLDFKISAENWMKMQSDLTANIGSSGGPGGGFPGDPGGATGDDFVPVWVETSVYFNSREWYHVGIRYKGNSSLRSAYRSGINKLSFKLDFDQFEDNYPALKNQRFYGFKQLNLKNNFEDASLMREKVAADLFREFGLVSSKVSFCTVYIDYGEGLKYFGVYSLVEEVDDTVLESQFGSDSGNLYKPDGLAASFAKGTFNSDQMEKKNNENLNDFTDVKNLYDVINSTDRINNTESWANNLESVFNVEIFLKWLASNTIIQNWDTYGKMTHNYYLYNNPDTYLLTWIPWDNNEAFQDGKQGGAPGLSLSEVNGNWPLIRYLLDRQEYREIYEANLQKFVNEVFTPEKMIVIYNNYYEMVKEYAYAEEDNYTFIKNETEFDIAVENLKSHVYSRYDAVNSYLNN